MTEAKSGSDRAWDVIVVGSGLGGPRRPVRRAGHSRGPGAIALALAGLHDARQLGDLLVGKHGLHVVEQAVVEQAGGTVVTLDGKPMKYNTKADILNPHFFVIGGAGRDWLALLPDSE